MPEERSLETRLGVSIPYEWWPTRPMLKEIEASGFGWVQLPSPPAAVLADPRACIRHARAAASSLAATSLRSVLHAPTDALAGEPASDRAIEGALSYAAECGAEAVVLHARALLDGPAAVDRMLAETRSLANLARTAERLGVALTLENLAPVFPGPETISANPLAVRTLARRINSPAVGLCLDIGHANVVAGLRRTSLTRMVEPVLDMATIFHLHDNLGARWHVTEARPDLDPLRLDLHLAPGRGDLNWPEVVPSLRAHSGPMILEIHPPRATPSKLMEAALGVLAGATMPARTALAT